jgi:uncharacterized membrane protein YphA (DoxX/SURF4 family)
MTSTVLATTEEPARGTSPKRHKQSVARYVQIAARFLMGLMFFVFGLNGFLDFLPHPTEPVPEGAMAFGAAMMKTGYFFPFVKGTEVVVGALLLANRFVPLALTVIAPVILNIIAFHAFLAPSGIAMGLVILVLEIYLGWSYRDVYRPMLAMRTAPATTK